MSASFARSKRAAAAARITESRKRSHSRRHSGKPAGEPARRLPRSLHPGEVFVTILRCRKHRIPKAGCVGCAVAQTATCDEIARAAEKTKKGGGA